MENGFYRNNKFHNIPVNIQQAPAAIAIKLLKLLTSPLHDAVRIKKMRNALLKIKFGVCTLGKWFVPSADELADFNLLALRFLQPDEQPYYKSILKSHKNYHAPADALSNIVLIEWIKCHIYHKRLIKTKNPRFLHLLIAVLYRPKKNIVIRVSERLELFGHKPTDDVRQRLTENNLEQRAKRIEKWKPWVKNAILLYYIGSVKRIAELNPVVFPKPDPDTDTKKTENAYGWDDTLYDISELKNKRIDEIAYWRFDEVLFLLTKAQKKNEQ